MSKLILLAAAAVVGIGTVATAYYINPVVVAASETPSILVDAAPAEVVRKIRTISMENYLVHMGVGADREKELLEVQFYANLSGPRAISETDTVFDLMRGSDHLMQFRINVKPTADGKSEVDVQTFAGNSKLKANPAIHPYDVQLVLSGAEFMATDYVSSILKGHPVLTGKRLEHEMKTRYALEEDAAVASMKRIRDTFLSTYAVDLREEAANYIGSEAALAGDFDGQDRSDMPIGPSNAAEFAAREADDALDDLDEERGW